MAYKLFIYHSNEVSAKYTSWIKNKSRSKNATYTEMYGEAHLKYTREESIAAFREKVNMVPWDILR